MEKWKTISSQYIYKTPFSNLRKDKCKLPNGYIIDGYYVNEYVDWVNGIVITKSNELIFVKQYRHGANDFFIEAIAGKMEDNENPKDGFLREVEEETGYSSKREPILLGKFYVNPATQNNCVYTFLILDAEKVSNQNLDETEEIEIVKYSIDEAIHKLKTNGFNHLFTVNALQLALNYINN